MEHWNKVFLSAIVGVVAYLFIKAVILHLYAISKGIKEGIFAFFAQTNWGEILFVPGLIIGSVSALIGYLVYDDILWIVRIGTWI